MIATYITVALAFWNVHSDHPVCPQGIAIQNAAAYAQVYQQAMPTDWVAAAPMQRDSCIIYINRPLFRKWDRRTKCAIIVHELGHSGVGLDHNPLPGKVMSEWPATPTVCKQFGQGKKP